MFNFTDVAVKFGNILKIGAAKRFSDKEFIETEIRRFKVSKRRKEMLDGEKYYLGQHDILSKKKNCNWSKWRT